MRKTLRTTSLLPFRKTFSPLMKQALQFQRNWPRLSIKILSQSLISTNSKPLSNHTNGLRIVVNYMVPRLTQKYSQIFRPVHEKLDIKVANLLDLLLRGISAVMITLNELLQCAANKGKSKSTKSCYKAYRCNSPYGTCGQGVIF